MRVKWNVYKERPVVEEVIANYDAQFPSGVSIRRTPQRVRVRRRPSTPRRAGSHCRAKSQHRLVRRTNRQAEAAADVGALDCGDHRPCNLLASQIAGGHDDELGTGKACDPAIT